MRECWASFYNLLPTGQQVVGAGMITAGISFLTIHLAYGIRMPIELPAYLVTLGIFALAKPEENNNVKPKQP